MEQVVLFRPVGETELKLIKESGYKKFPPRLIEQPIFYPLLNKGYAEQIAKKWNAKNGEKGYVTMFKIKKEYISNFEIHRVGNEIHEEYWIEANELDNFNNNILGKIEVIETFLS